MYVVIKNCTSGCQHLSPNNQSISQLVKKQYANKIYLLTSWISVGLEVRQYSFGEVLMFSSLPQKMPTRSFRPVFNAIPTFTSKPCMCLEGVLVIRCDEIARAEEWSHVLFFPQRMSSKGSNCLNHSFSYFNVFAAETGFYLCHKYTLHWLAIFISLKGIVLATGHSFEVNIILGK